MIKYGSTTTTVHHANYENVSTKTVYTERVPVSSPKDILAAFLKLHKKYVDDSLHNIEIKLIEKKGEPQFVDLTWSE